MKCRLNGVRDYRVLRSGLLFPLQLLNTCTREEAAPLLRSESYCISDRQGDMKRSAMCKVCLHVSMLCLLTATSGLFIWTLFSALQVSIPHMRLSCSNASSTNASGIRLYVGVISTAGNVQKRMVIRKTWGSDSQLQRLVFVVANPTQNATLLSSLLDEAADFNDLIILGQIEESYFNITYQTLEIFRSAYAYHGPITHVMKCDDDSYLHVAKLLTFLAAHPSNLTYLGRMEAGYFPHRDPKDFWYVSKDEWPDDNSSNLTWAHGSGYIVTKDLAMLLASGTAYRCSLGRLFRLEDVAVGHWLHCLQEEKQWSIHKVHNPHINLLGCAHGDVISHHLTPDQMQCMFAANGGCC